MKFALVNGQRQEAQPDLSGKCPACADRMVAKCGEVKIWHWAHLGTRLCDAWWENETEWHRAWKGRFPITWQEVVHQTETGERHISDVKTDRGWVIEFQHSYLKPEERRSRDAFYPKLIWVADGTRRKRDAEKFFAAWHESSPVGNSSFVRRLHAVECALAREWAGSDAPIFLDFGDEQALWWLTYGRPEGSVYVAPLPHADFIRIHRSDATQKDLFDELVKKLGGLVAADEALLQAQAQNRASLPRGSFQQYGALRNRGRRRL